MDDHRPGQVVCPSGVAGVRTHVPDGRHFGDVAVENGVKRILVRQNTKVRILPYVGEGTLAQLGPVPFCDVDVENPAVEEAVWLGHAERPEVVERLRRSLLLAELNENAPGRNGGNLEVPYVAARISGRRRHEW